MKNDTEKRGGQSQDPVLADATPAQAAPDSRLNRRAFLTGIGLGSAAFLLSPLHLPATFMNTGRELLSCIGSFGVGDTGTLHLLHVRNGKSTVLHSVPSVRPIAITLHPSRSLLYVANGISEYQYHPRGTVEVFAVDPSSAKLELVHRQALSLSAIRPTSLAVSPDDQNLLVTAFEGGTYNMLPLDRAGLPGAPSTILKQVGHGEHTTEQASAHPSHVLFHPDAQFAIAADYGADRLDILTTNGEDQGAPAFMVSARVDCPAGSGPRHLTLHNNGDLLAVAHNLRPSLSIFRISPGNSIQTLASTSRTAPPTAICFHPQQDVLYSAENHLTHRAFLTTWRIDRLSGSLRLADQIAVPAAEVTAIHHTASRLWLASNRGLFAVQLSPHTGVPYEANMVAAVPNARSLVMFQ